MCLPDVPEDKNLAPGCSGPARTLKPQPLRSEIPELTPIDRTARKLQAPALLGADE